MMTIAVILQYILCSSLVSTPSVLMTHIHRLETTLIVRYKAQYSAFAYLGFRQQPRKATYLTDEVSSRQADCGIEPE